MPPSRFTRRSLLHRAGVGLAAAAAAPLLADRVYAAVGRAGTAKQQAAGAVTLPSGLHPHVRTFMAWPALTSIWGRRLSAVRNDVATVAQTIAEYEPVVMIARPELAAAAQRACGSGVEVIEIANDDLWMRDIGPTFVSAGGALAGVDTNFNGWGNKPRYRQPFANDAKVASALLAYYGVPRIDAPLVTEGGALEPDGQGTLLATSSSIVNANRNPGKSQAQLTQLLDSTFGLSKVIWFAGVAGQDITDDHVDALARFTATPGAVLLERAAPGTPPDAWTRSYDQAASVLAGSTDAQGRAVTVIDLPEPDYANIRYQGDQSTFLASYVNFYVANGAVFVPQFGDAAADSNAAGILRDQFPGYDVVQLNIDNIAAGGGGIHCATQQQPDLSTPA